jgi:hypothetical protein
MSLFQHPLWGYQLAYPDDWVHLSIGDAEGFAAHLQALESGYEGPKPGQLLVSAEWNCARRPIGPLWSQHIGLMAGMLGAKQIGSAPWRMGGAVGVEAEIVLSKKENRRLWAGILEKDFTVLKFMVTHPSQDRAWFEPAATRILSSLSFAGRVEGTAISPEDLPLPPGYTPSDPSLILADIANPESWRAYDGKSQAGALQAFFLREAPNYGWQIIEYVPFPSDSDLGFARLDMQNDTQRAVLGILPFEEPRVTSTSPAKLVFKIG